MAVMCSIALREEASREVVRENSARLAPGKLTRVLDMFSFIQRFSLAVRFLNP
jgi:hypothetical protein